MDELLLVLIAMLPKGAYSLDADTRHMQELLAIATVLNVFDNDEIGGLLQEVFPDSATRTLADWERVLKPRIDGSASTAQRRAALVEKWARQGSQSRAFIIQQFTTYTDGDITPGITEFTQLWGAFTWGDQWLDENVFSFLVHISPADVATYSIDRDEMQILLNALKPAHTQGTFVSDSLIYDNAYYGWGLSMWS